MTEPTWRRYLRFWGPDVRADIDDEMEFHIELRVAELVAHGWTPAAARAEALQRIGDLQALKHTCQSIDQERVQMKRRREWLGMLWNDARIGVRQFARTPMLAFVAILTLALGLGANTAIFSVVYAVLLRPLPYADSDRMVAISETYRSQEMSVGPGQFTEWAKRNRAFEAIAAQNWTTFNLGDEGEPERVVAAYVSPSFFTAQYAPPERGRYFRPEEAHPGREHVVVLSHGLFVGRFAGDPSIVGRTIHLNDEPYVVVGVAPSDYVLTSGGERLWVPLALTPQHESTFGDSWLRVIGKVRPGVTRAAAQRDLERVTREIAALHPKEMKERSISLQDFRADVVEDFSRQLTVLFGAVGFVLLLACLNVANLLLARVTLRRKEIAIRSALGASRGRIVLQFLVESVVLALAGGAAALLVSVGTLRLLLKLAPTGVPRIEYAAQDSHALVFLAIATLGCGIVLGFLPALRGLGGDLQGTLREGGKSSSVGSARDSLRSALVIAEIALAVVLLTGAGLFIRSAAKLNKVEPGFDATNLLSFRVSLPPARYKTPEQVTSAYTQMAERLRALPSVRAVELTSEIPLAGPGIGVGLHLEGKPDDDPSNPTAQFRLVSPGYFRTMRIPLRSGRELAPTDQGGTPPVIVINETFARLVWPNENPLGKRLYCCGDDSVRVFRGVVGVTADVRHTLTQEPAPEFYLPYTQVPPVSLLWLGNSLALLVRTNGAPNSALPDVRRVMHDFDPALPLFAVQSYDELLRGVTANNRFSMQLLSALALLALVLAAVGIYGVLSYFVNQRTEEISVRVALGARAADVIGLVVRQGGKLAGAGVVIGVLLALATSRSLNHLLFDVKPTDALTYVLVSVTLGAIALFACWLPARRAAALDPAATLRS